VELATTPSQNAANGTVAMGSRVGLIAPGDQPRPANPGHRVMPAMGMAPRMITRTMTLAR